MAIIERRRELLGGGLPTTKAFSECTMEELDTFAPYAQKLVNAGIWTIGDTNDNARYSSYRGIRLIHVLTEEQRGDNYYGTSGHIVVDFTKVIAYSAWNNSYHTAVSYSSSTVLTKLNSMYSSGSFNSEFISVIKTFSPPTSVQDSYSERASTSVEHPSGYLHLPNCYELRLSNGYRYSENTASFRFDYYSDGQQSKRQKTGAYENWSLRSPSECSGASDFYAYYIYYTGEMNQNTVNNYRGISPIAVI